MKKFFVVLAVALLLPLATPALAGHDGHYRHRGGNWWIAPAVIGGALILGSAIAGASQPAPVVVVPAPAPVVVYPSTVYAPPVRDYAWHYYYSCGAYPWGSAGRQGCAEGANHADFAARDAWQRQQDEIRRQQAIADEQARRSGYEYGRSLGGLHYPSQSWQ